MIFKFAEEKKASISDTECFHSEPLFHYSELVVVPNLAFIVALLT